MYELIINMYENFFFNNWQTINFLSVLFQITFSFTKNKHILGRVKIVSVHIGHHQYILACWSETGVAYLALI